MKNIIIYPHFAFNPQNGGITVQFYLAQILKELGCNVKMFNNHGTTQNYIFNDYITNITSEELENTVVIYCEGITGNPLNAKYVVRWMLSELGKNVPIEHLKTWGKNELVYYFNPEPKFEKNKELIGSVYKILYLNYINPLVVNLNLERSGWCYTLRKYFYHKQINMIHPNNATRLGNIPINIFVQAFNKHKYFISYDPLTFYTIIAILCGCISVVYPVEGMDKKTWISNTSIGDYINNTQNGEIYGLAYGLSDLKYAEETIHLAPKQYIKLKEYMINKMVNPFIKDINNWDKNINTINNNF